MKLLIFTFLIFSFQSKAQSEDEVEKALSKIESFDQADSLKEAHKSWKILSNEIYLGSFFYDSILFHSTVGSIVRKQYKVDSPVFLNKVVSKGKEELCKVDYIFLDGKAHTMKEINNLRTLIIKKYQEGISFVDLAAKYNEDGNFTGELPWFHKGAMVDEFDEAVRNKKTGEIFTVDVPNNQWYYVILKTEENMWVECTYAVGIVIKD